MVQSKDGLCHHSLLRAVPLKVPGITSPWHVLFEVCAWISVAVALHLKVNSWV